VLFKLPENIRLTPQPSAPSRVCMRDARVPETREQLHRGRSEVCGQEVGEGVVVANRAGRARVAGRTSENEQPQETQVT
jgi:hypothetical protein